MGDSDSAMDDTPGRSKPGHRGSNSPGHGSGSYPHGSSPFGQTPEMRAAANYTRSLRHSYGGEDISSAVYRVSLPPTPDHQIGGDGYDSPTPYTGESLGPGGSPRWRNENNSIVASTLFTGGYERDPRGHIMMTNDHQSLRQNKNIDPQVGPRTLRCQMNGCDGLAMRDGSGNVLFPCECSFIICRECYNDVMKDDAGTCPGCKERYTRGRHIRADKNGRQQAPSLAEGDEDEIDDDDLEADPAIDAGPESSHGYSAQPTGGGRLPGGYPSRQASRPAGVKGLQSRSSVDSDSSCDGPPRNLGGRPMDAATSAAKGQGQLALVRKEDQDLQVLLYGDSKAEYGYGSAVWPKDDSKSNKGGSGGGGGGDGVVGGAPQFDERGSRPLCRKIPVSAAMISPYRFLVLLRLVILVFFLRWRFLHPTPDAQWLWLASVICEAWFGFSWILDQFPKLCPINRVTDLDVLREKFEGPLQPLPSPDPSAGSKAAPMPFVAPQKSFLPGVDVFVSTADPEKEPVLTTGNTVLSILASDYPVEKLACYVSDDGGALLTFEALAETASFARLWIPFCRKHNIEPRAPDAYFAQHGDPTRGKLRPDFVRDRRRVKREYDEFKVRINGLPDAIRRRSEDLNAREELRLRRAAVMAGKNLLDVESVKATWMADGSKWPGTWNSASPDHARGDHAGIIQVMLAPPSDDVDNKSAGEVTELIDVMEVDTRLPLLVYVSREKRPGYDHNKKAGAMNALVRTSAIMSNGPFILNLDCDHYINYSQVCREAMCFMMARGGERICFVQFPQRFDGIDPNDRYANNNTVYFDVNMRGLDGLQGPMYVGTGCVFRRTSLYGFDPPLKKKKQRGCCLGMCCCGGSRKAHERRSSKDAGVLNNKGGSQLIVPSKNGMVEIEDDMEVQFLPKRFGSSQAFLASIPIAEEAGKPLGAGDRGLVDENGKVEKRSSSRHEGERPALDAEMVADAILVISSWYEDKTEWGRRVGWIYGSVTEDIVTGYRMHNRGWKSVYCITKRAAFKGTAPINLTDRLHQVLRWATGSVEIFFSRNNALLGSSGLKCLQRVAYLGVAVYPFTSIFLTAYCFLPAISLLTDKFIIPEPISLIALIYILSLTLCTFGLAMMEVRWGGITLDDWWRNEQFWVIGGTSAHLAAVYQGLLKVLAGTEISFTLTAKASASEEEDDPYRDLYVFKWTSLLIPPLVIMMVNIIACVVGFSRTVYARYPRWSDLLGKLFFAIWVLIHLYPFARGLMGKRNKTPTIVFVWAGLVSILVSLLWITIAPPTADNSAVGDNSFSFP